MSSRSRGMIQASWSRVRIPEKRIICQRITLFTLFKELGSQIGFPKTELGSEEWEEIEPRGGKQHDIRLVDHSMVYHLKSHSLIVYGGILADAAPFSKLSDRLFMFNLEPFHCTELLYPPVTFPWSEPLFTAPF